jgi:hypothetical protein
MVFEGLKRTLDPSKFATDEEHKALLDEVNQRKRRAPRPGQLPPSSRGHRHRSVGWDDDGICEDPVEAAGGSRRSSAAAPDSECTDWAARKQVEQEHWRAKRKQNQQMAQQHEAFDGPTISQLKVDLELDCATQSIALALTRHTCCVTVLTEAEALQLARQVSSQLLAAAQHDPAAEQQQQQQHPAQNRQQQQQPQQQEQEQRPPGAAALLTVRSMRAVACHVSGASYWLPIPTVSCSHCGDTWELEPAAAGFCGSSPIQPGVLFSTQVLNAYTSLYGSGVSATAYAECLSKTAARVPSYSPALPRVVTSINNIDDR